MLILFLKKFPNFYDFKFFLALFLQFAANFVIKTI